MFNLIVSSAWKNQGSGSLMVGRVFEYTSPELEMRFKPQGILNASAVMPLPTILMDEGTGQEVARIVRLNSITSYQFGYILHYSVDQETPHLTNADIYALRSDLHIFDNFEFHRNHWAVKDVDLFHVLYHHKKLAKIPTPAVSQAAWPSDPTGFAQAVPPAAWSAAQQAVAPPASQAVSRAAWSAAQQAVAQPPPTAISRAAPPTVFELSSKPINPKLISFMMPFSTDFSPVYQDVKMTLEFEGYECLRADEIWVNRKIMTDIVELICTSRVIVCDLSKANPNVLYETGIAHACGKEVILITQCDNDVPLDLRSIRYLKYLDNKEGRAMLASQLLKRVQTLT